MTGISKEQKLYALLVTTYLTEFTDISPTSAWQTAMGHKICMCQCAGSTVLLSSLWMNALGE